MTDRTFRVGRLTTQPIGSLADKAVDWLFERRSPSRYAVTCDPEGLVQIERAADAVPDDIVGVYNPASIDGEGALARTRLWRRIAEDLRHHRQVAHG